MSYGQLHNIQQGKVLGLAPGTQQPDAMLQAEGRVAGKQLASVRSLSKTF